MTIAEKIKKIRLLNDMTQEQFSQELGISRSTLIAYEKNSRKVPVNILLKITEKFNINLNEFKNYSKGSNYTVPKDDIMILKDEGLISSYNVNEEESLTNKLKAFKQYLSANGYPVDSLSNEEIKELHDKTVQYIDFELFKKGYIKISDK